MLLMIFAVMSLSQEGQSSATTSQALRWLSCSSLETPQGILHVDRIAHVYFETGSTTIPPQGAAMLDSFLFRFEAPSHCQVIVWGHADRVGSAADNLRLSERRANAVAAYLRRNGLTAPMVITGKGETGLLVDTPDEVAERQNRYVEVFIDEPERPER